MIDLSGKTLTSVELDDAGILFLGTAGGWLVSVENDYELIDPGGRQSTLDGAEGTMVGTLTGLVGDAVTAFRIDGDGGLSIVCGGRRAQGPLLPRLRVLERGRPEPRACGLDARRRAGHLGRRR